MMSFEVLMAALLGVWDFPRHRLPCWKSKLSYSPIRAIWMFYYTVDWLHWTTFHVFPSPSLEAMLTRLSLMPCTFHYFILWLCAQTYLEGKTRSRYEYTKPKLFLAPNQDFPANLWSRSIYLTRIVNGEIHVGNFIFNILLNNLSLLPYSYKLFAWWFLRYKLL